uniref:Uncharacterized protein n=1 Tax=Siphoviridae sp. ctRuT6 TaxID=2826339 RepID=A0A8S5N2Q3_9CAUD|nr:MAG TPA: hypothetical protein [Siphoviridae sp. ctRuT6]
MNIFQLLHILFIYQCPFVCIVHGWTFAVVPVPTDGKRYFVGGLTSQN